MRPKTTPDEPGFPPRHGFASYLGRGLWLGALILAVTGLLTWLIIEWLMS